jgi:hypothetical protein
VVVTVAVKAAAAAVARKAAEAVQETETTAGATVEIFKIKIYVSMMKRTNK